MSIYFDNASTTETHPLVKDEMIKWISKYGNPSSIYEIGLETKNKIEEVREECAKSINADPEEIFFTSGGSEANNFILKGLYNPNFPNSERTILTTEIEHHSILNTVGYLERVLYANVCKMEPQLDGTIWIKDVEDYCEQHFPKIVSIMGVNNEIGTINNIRGIANACIEYGSIFHVDAVQMYPHINIDVKKKGIDALSVSAHKFHGPKGVGFAYVNKDFHYLLEPLIHGGQQENGYRAGTENIIGIVGLGKAVELRCKQLSDREQKIADISELFMDMMSGISEAHLNCKHHKIPGILSYRFDNIRGEELREYLNSNGIYVSTGSACDSRSGKPSHVLKSIGLSDEEANSTIRFSFSSFNTEDEVEKTVKCIKTGISLLSY